MEDGNGDKDGERFRRRGWRTVTETTPVNRAENEDGERRRETRMKDGNGDDDGEQFRRRGRRTVQETNPVNRAENEDGGR